MDIHLKVQYVINIVVCIWRISTFQTELVAKRMANIRSIGTAYWAQFSFPCGLRIEIILKILNNLINNCVFTNSCWLWCASLRVLNEETPL